MSFERLIQNAKSIANVNLSKFIYDDQHLQKDREHLAKKWGIK